MQRFTRHRCRLCKIDFDPETLHGKILPSATSGCATMASANIEVKAEFSHYVDDPYVEPGFSRAPVFDDVEFAIIGGGFGGLLMGAGACVRPVSKKSAWSRAPAIWRHVVLEPLSGRDVRCGELLLSAAA